MTVIKIENHEELKTRIIKERKEQSICAMDW